MRTPIGRGVWTYTGRTVRCILCSRSAAGLMDLESGTSLLSKSCGCYSKIKAFLSSERVLFFYVYFFHILAALDLTSDVYVMIIYFQKNYFIFGICSAISLALPSLITSTYLIISFSDTDEVDCGYLFGSFIKVLCFSAFYLIWPILVVLRPLVLKEEIPFEEVLSKNYSFICCIFESIPQLTINLLFLRSEKTLNIPNLISLGCSAGMILYGIIRGCLQWEEFNFRNLAFDLDYENDGS